MKKFTKQITAGQQANLSTTGKASKKTVQSGRSYAQKAAALLLFFLISVSGFATTYYSRTNGGNWNVATTWSTVTYGNATNSTGSYPQAGDVANIGNGYTIYINAAVNVATLNIGQGVSGVLEFKSTTNYTVTVSGNVTVNTGAKFWYNTATARTHQVNIAGNLVNYGVVDFYVGVGQLVNLTFNGTSNSSVTGTGTWDLNTVTMNKSTAITYQVNVQASTFEAAIRNFVGTYGTYIHNNASTYSINPTTATFTIGPNTVYKVPLGIMWFASAADNVILQGQLYVNGGKVYIGTTAGLQGIRYDQNGTQIPYLEVSSGGTLQVYGGITYGTTSSTEPFSFYLNNATVLLNSGTTGSNRQLFYINDVASSSFVMSSGTMTFQKPNTAGALTIDCSINGTNGTVNVTGGTMQFGNASTAAGSIFNFRPYANALYPNFKVTGSSANTTTLATSYGSTSNFKLMSLYIDVNKTFDIRSIGGALGDTKQMTLTSTTNGVDAIYNSGSFLARSSTVTFNPSGAQAIGGTTSTTFYNLTINNASNITLNYPTNVSNILSMVLGKLNTTNTNVLTIGSTGSATIGNNLSFVDGPMIQTVATVATVNKTFPIGKGNAYRPAVLTVTHSNATSVTYRGEIFNSAASGLPYGLPTTISNVSAVRYLRFTRSLVSNFSSGKVQMYYDIDDGVANKNTLLVAHDDGTATWQNFGGSATANWTGNIISGTFTNFHTYFALGNPPGGGNPLPIELTAFSAKFINKAVNVSWSTQTEINNDHFTVERSSDNETYTPIGIVEGAGTSSTAHTYSLIDEQPLSGISYYRLRQTDYDGKSETFKAVVVQNKGKGVVTIFPNPATSSSTVHIAADQPLDFASVTVQDLTGKTIPSSAMMNENGTIDLRIDDSYMQKGAVYFISVSDGSSIIREKLFIN